MALLTLLLLAPGLLSADAGSTCATPNYICACDPNCQGSWEYPPGYNTLDECEDGIGQSDYDWYEWVEKMIVTDLNGTNFKGGDTINIYSQFYCYPGDIYAIAYSNYSNGNDTVWENIYSGTCPVYNYYDVYYNYTLDDNEGGHALRFIIAYPGTSSMTCGQDSSDSDTDDIVFYVMARPDLSAPSVTAISPSAGQSFEYSAGVVIPINVTASDATGIDKIIVNVTWAGGATSIQLNHSSGDLYVGNISGLTNTTRYNVSITSNDTINNTGYNYTHFFIVNNYGINITSPVLSQTYNHSDIALAFRVNDNNTPYQDVYFSLNSGEATHLFYGVSAQNNKSESTEMYTTNNLTNISQSFTPAENLTVNLIKLKLKKSSANSYLTYVQVRTDSSGAPSDTILLNTTLNSSMVSQDEFYWVNITFNTTVTFTNGTKYWLFLNASGDSTNYYQWEANLNNYSSGELLSNTSMDMLFVVHDRYKYNITINASEGTNSIDLCEIDSIGVTECTVSSFAVDTTPPNWSTPTETSDPFELSTSYQFVSIYLNDATSSIGTVTIEANYTNQSTDSLGSGTYQYRWSVSGVGTYVYRFLFNDSAGNFNFTSYFNFTVQDTTPPLINNTMQTPNISGDLDPNVTINVSTNITDYSAITSSILQYRLTSLSEWLNASMANASSMYNGSFTPTSEGVWTYRIYSIDVYNNSNASAETNTSVYYDRTWESSPTQFDEVFTTEGSTVNIGNITINNTGDYALQFSISKVSGIPTVGINQTSLTINSKENAIINISTSAPEQNPTPYAFSLFIECLTGECETNNATINGSIAVGEGGPFITFYEVTYDPSVTQGDRSVLLNTTIKNIGNETAVNATINWSMPEDWTTSSNLSKYVGNITPYQTSFQTESYGLSASVPLNATTGELNVTITVNYFKSDGEAMQKTITKTVTVSELDTGEEEEEEEETQPSSGGGGGGGGRGGSGGGMLLPKEYSLSFIFTNRTEILRGSNKTIIINITNNNSIIIANLSLSIIGFPVSRYSVQPEMILSLEPNESSAFEVTFNAPLYMGYSTHSLTLLFSGKTKYSQNSTANNYSQQSEMFLIISEVEESEVLSCIVDSEIIINDMRKLNMSVAGLEKMLPEIKRKVLEKILFLAKEKKQ